MATSGNADCWGGRQREQPIYIVDPFGTTRDYDEGLYRGISNYLPATHLLTTRFNDRRQVSAALGEGFFLRGTHRLHRRFSGAPLRVLKALGAAEYFSDLQPKI